jgi:hypothetical protein
MRRGSGTVTLPLPAGGGLFPAVGIAPAVTRGGGDGTLGRGWGAGDVRRARQRRRGRRRLGGRSGRRGDLGGGVGLRAVPAARLTVARIRRRCLRRGDLVRPGQPRARRWRLLGPRPGGGDGTGAGATPGRPRHAARRARHSRRLANRHVLDRRAGDRGKRKGGQSLLGDERHQAEAHRGGDAQQRERRTAHPLQQAVAGQAGPDGEPGQQLSSPREHLGAHRPPRRRPQATAPTNPTFDWVIR